MAVLAGGWNLIEAATQGSLAIDTDDSARPKDKPKRVTRKQRANSLDGATWTRNSISIWSDIKKTPEEMALGHPALFPTALVLRLLACYASDEDRVILDPFVGTGSTAIAAESTGRTGIGLEISPEFAEKARQRPPLPQGMLEGQQMTELGERRIISADARRLLDYVKPETVDMVITSPPYWDILLRRRTADYKATRHYGDAVDDLGKIADYQGFIRELERIFWRVAETLKQGKYCCVVVMDLRKGDRFYPYHMDVVDLMQHGGFVLQDIIIWDRRHEYSNMRPLGYPYRFIVNKAHEYILIFRKR